MADSRVSELLFPIIWKLIKTGRRELEDLLGNPPKFLHLDLSLLRFSGMILNGASFDGCLLQDTDFSQTNLQNSEFPRSILDRTRLDGASITAAKFREAEISSIYVYDKFVTKTSAVLQGREAKQWLFSSGGDVDDVGLNLFLGKPWYEAVREVVRTIDKRPFGTHQSRSLIKGTDVKERPYAEEFVNYLLRNGGLDDLGKSYDGGRLVKANPSQLSELTEFGRTGKIGPNLLAFFDRHRQ